MPETGLARVLPYPQPEEGADQELGANDVAQVNALMEFLRALTRDLSLIRQLVGFVDVRMLRKAFEVAGVNPETLQYLSKEAIEDLEWLQTLARLLNMLDQCEGKEGYLQPRGKSTTRTGRKLTPPKR